MKLLVFLYILLIIFPVFGDELKFSWSLTFPGHASGIFETTDSTFIVGGSKLLKFSAQGDIIWEKDFPCQIMNLTSDGGIILLKGNEIVKMSAGGETEWSKFSGGFPCIKPTFDGGYIAVGTAYNEFPVTYYSNREIIVARYSANFDLEWSKIYSFGDLHDDGRWVIQTADSNYVIAARVSKSDDNPNSYGRGLVMKIDQTGDVLWKQEGSTNVFALFETSNHSILAATQFLIAQGPSGAFLFLYDQNGKFIWCSDGDPHGIRSYPRKTWHGDILYAGIETRQGTYLGVGQRLNQVWILELKADGWEKNDFIWGSGWFNSIIQTKAGDYVLTGVNEGQAYIARFQIVPDELGITQPTKPSAIPEHYVLYQNYPNPFNAVSIIRFTLPGTSWVDLTLYNVLGTQIAILLSEERTIGEHEFQLDASNLSSGVYWYRLKADGFIDIKKIVVLK